MSNTNFKDTQTEILEKQDDHENDCNTDSDVIIESFDYNTDVVDAPGNFRWCTIHGSYKGEVCPEPPPHE